MLVNRQFNTIRNFLLFVLVILTQQTCIKSDPTNISSDINTQPEYSLPIGTPTVWMNQIVTSVDLGEPIDTLEPILDSLNTFLYDNTYYKPSNHVFDYSITEPFSFITFKNQLDKIKSFMLRVNTINQISCGDKTSGFFQG